MKSLLEELLDNKQIESFFTNASFTVVKEALSVNEVSFNHYDFLTEKSHTATVFFNSLIQSLSFIFPNFTDSEIKSLSSTAYFYFDLFPFPQIMETIHSSNFKLHLLHREDKVYVNFNLFTISFRLNQWFFGFSDSAKNEQKFESISFKAIHEAMLTSFKDLISDVMIKPPKQIDNTVISKIINNRSSFTFNAMRYKDIFTHELDVDFAKHIQENESFIVVDEINPIKHVAQPSILYVKGEIRTTRNILHVAKLVQTQVYFRYESLYFIEQLFSVALTFEQIIALKKIIKLIHKINLCFDKETYPGIEICRLNYDKRATYNLIKEKNMFYVKFGRNTIRINRYIDCSIIINNSYKSIQVESFEDAYNYIYNVFIEHVANYFNIDETTVNDDYIKLLEMVNH